MLHALQVVTYICGTNFLGEAASQHHAGVSPLLFATLLP